MGRSARRARRSAGCTAVDTERDDVVLRVQRAHPEDDERGERRKSDDEVAAHAGARSGVAGPVVHRVDDHEVREEEEEAVRLRVVGQPAEHPRNQAGPASHRVVLSQDDGEVEAEDARDQHVRGQEGHRAVERDHDEHGVEHRREPPRGAERSHECAGAQKRDQSVQDLHGVDRAIRREAEPDERRQLHRNERLPVGVDARQLSTGELLAG